MFYLSQKICKLLAFSLESQKFFSITRTIFLTVGQNNFGNKINTNGKSLYCEFSCCKKPIAHFGPSLQTPNYHHLIYTSLITIENKITTYFKVIHPKYYKHLKKGAHQRQTKNGLVSGRLACTSSKTEMLNKIGI